MHYEGNIIRPPSEANSILLQVTVGCSRNKCTFCGAYQGERFKIKSDEIIMADIAFAATHCQRQRRVFLCDGDALIIPQKRLMKILTEIRRQLPWVTRVGVYANAKSLNMKTVDELKALRENGIGIAYMGLETGDDVTLKAINKGATAQQMIDMGKKARQAGIKLSITVLLGLAGRERSQIHARETGRVLSAIDPEYVGALSLMLIPGTPMHEDATQRPVHPHRTGRNAGRAAHHDRRNPPVPRAVSRQPRLQLPAHPRTHAQGESQNPGPDRRGAGRQGGPASGVDAGALIRHGNHP